MLQMSGPAAYCAAGPTTLTFVVSEGNNHPSSPSFAMPSAANVGDLAILFGRYVDSSSVVPVGWTALLNYWDAGNGPSYMCYRIKQTGDGTFQHTPGKSSYAQMIAVFRPNLTISQVVPVSFAISGPTSGDPTAQIVPAGGYPYVVVAAYQSSLSGLSPRGFTPTKDGEQAAGTATNLYLAWKVFNGGATSVTVDGPDNGDLNYTISGYVEVH